MIFRRRALFALSALALVAGVFAPAVSASADTSNFEFDSFHADYSLTKAADDTSQLSVVETIVAVFPESDQNRGIVRQIPDFSASVPLHTEVTSITDENGTPVPWEESEDGDFRVLSIGTDDFVHGVTTYVISYTQTDVVRVFSDTASDEFYWDVNGTGSDQPFGEVSAAVTIDSALTPALTGNASCYEGESGSDRECDTIDSSLQPDGSTVYTVSSADLEPHNTLSLSLGFEQGTFVPGVPIDRSEPPVVYEDTPLWTYLLTAMGLIAGIALIVFASISRGLRGAKGRGVIVPQYSVPAGLNVMAAAHLVERPQTAIPAQLVSLAVRKNLRILDYPVSDSAAEYSLQFLTMDGADPFEADLLRALFGPQPLSGAVRDLTPDDATLGREVNDVSTATIRGLQTSGLRGKRSGLGCLFPSLGLVLIIGGIVLQVATFAAGAFSLWPAAVFAIGVIAVIVSGIRASGPPPLTAAGAERRDYLLGMKMYLELAEQERFRMLQSPDGSERVDIGDTKQVIKVYEKLLPFAVIWGVEDQWMHELEVRVVQDGEQPDWFLSTGGFQAAAFTTALRGASSLASYTPPATTSSYSGSSFSSSHGGSTGGGFAGGGGGGGGVGGR